jgi:hypothetical protein
MMLWDDNATNLYTVKVSHKGSKALMYPHNMTIISLRRFNVLSHDLAMHGI